MPSSSVTLTRLQASCRSGNKTADSASGGPVSGGPKLFIGWSILAGNRVMTMRFENDHALRELPNSKACLFCAVP